MGKLAIIGGSGLYALEGLTDVASVVVDTPFGPPSDELVTGTLGDTALIFLPRHGRGHRLLPSEINFRANVWALKKLGATRIISVSAVGSMKDEIQPGHLVVPDQFIDRTNRRTSTFFGDGLVAHVSLADPVCPVLSHALFSTAKDLSIPVHNGGTYICMEGPQFSTRAESHAWRAWGVSVIGMTNMPEARLAREAELCYATLALSTDYDCWHETEKAANVEDILAVMRTNIANAKRVVADLAPRVGALDACSCGSALAGTILTDAAVIPGATREKLDLLVGKYL